MDPAFTELPKALFRLLRQMDEKAEALPDGTITGLRAYQAYAVGSYSGQRGRPWENSWSDRLAELLEKKGWFVERECRFKDRPASRERCDLKLTKGPLRVWLEVKGAWHRLVDDDLRPGKTNAAYRKH